jgi:hypothetical protein
MNILIPKPIEWQAISSGGLHFHEMAFPVPVSRLRFPYFNGELETGNPKRYVYRLFRVQGSGFPVKFPKSKTLNHEP